jgi:hypothetical protein
MHSDMSPIHPDMPRHSLRCLLTAPQGCSAGSLLVPCLIERLELMSLCIKKNSRAADNPGCSTDKGKDFLLNSKSLQRSCQKGL